MKTIWKATVCIVAVLLSFSIYSCGDDDDDGDNREVFYILCGWMSVTDATAFQKEIADDQNLYCFVETDPYSTAHGEPPTKLKNPKIFRPFEMFVKMYGLPSYHEMDPTIFVALTYMFIFGAMFGDAGQGACLVIGGFLLYKFKKLDLAAIIGTAGIFSTFFGLMFGSIFGFEDANWHCVRWRCGVLWQ